jgi:hypothetical protein
MITYLKPSMRYEITLCPLCLKLKLIKQNFLNLFESELSVDFANKTKLLDFFKIFLECLLGPIQVDDEDGC